MYRRYTMKLKKLMKVYDKDSYIRVNDLKSGVNTSVMTFSEFKEKYGKDAMNRKVSFIEPDISSRCTIVIDIY